MAKKQILEYIFEPGISKDNNLYPNAVALLLANKAFLQAQVVAFINYNIENQIGIYDGYSYEPSKCIRDVGFFIDAIAHDLRYGGNVKIRQVSEYFWIDGRPMIRGNPLPEIQGQQYLRDIINTFIFNNTLVSPTYDQTAINQIRFIGQNAESGANTVNSSLWNILSTVIQNGTTAIPTKVSGVSSLKLLGKYNSSELLLITDTNNGKILYNFSDPLNAVSIEYKDGKSSGDGQPLSDLDFPRWVQTTDSITTLYLSEDTTNLSADSKIQIFVEEPYQTIRPWDFGTDAIERMRVAAPQAMLDADFEYGLQPTKWQAIGLLRSYPSIYELPGSDTSVTEITTDASISNGGFGASLITVRTVGPHGFTKGTPITIKGLSSSVNGFSRAEGAFIINSVPNPLIFTYYSSAKVGLVNGETLFTSFIQLRAADFYTGASIGSTQFNVPSNGSSIIITSKFDTPIGSTSLAFDGTAPTPGSPISGSSNLVPGTAVSGVVGTATVIAKVLDTVTSTDQTTITLVDLTDVQQGMAIDDGSNSAVFINSIAQNTLNLSGSIGQLYTGANGITEGISGTNITGIGTGAAFDIFRSTGVYNVESRQDSTANGENYDIGDQIRILGSLLGGINGTNDVLITVTEIDSGGSIINFTFQGTAISGGAIYGPVLQSSTTGSGTGFTITVERIGGTGQYIISVNNGGSSHAQNDVITFAGTNFGGTSPTNDITIRVDGVTFGDQAVADFTVLSGVGVSGNETYIAIPGTNLSPTGINAIFDIIRINGNYEGVVRSAGSGYIAGNKILILGSSLDGSSELNDAVVTVSAVGSNGGILGVTVGGTPYDGDSITVYPALTLSEAITGDILDDTVLNVGAIATVEISFDGNHGLVPGAAILTNVTSTPNPLFLSENAVLPSSGTWTGVSFANGRFVAVRSGSNLTAVSSDGEFWDAGGNLPSSAAWTSVAGGEIEGNRRFVAVASGGTAAAYSLDSGATWLSSTLPSSGTWTSVEYNEGVFVSVRSGSNAGAYSLNGGQTWVASTLPTTANWSDVASGILGTLTYFVAISTGSNSAAYSTDLGATWAASTLPSSSTWASVVFGDSKFVAIARNTVNAAITTNGIAWTAQTLPSTANWNSIAYGDDTFVVVADGSTSALTSFTGLTGQWAERTLSSSATWEEIAYGNYNGLGIFPVVGNNASANFIKLVSANHNLAAGPFIVTEVPNPTTIRYPARTTGTINITNPISGLVYVRPDVFFVHRPFDGGVQLGTGGPQHGAHAVRQSKKYIRYQSGKGIMYTTGALFAPSYDLSAVVAVDTVQNSIIRLTVDDLDHGIQPGAVVEITGMDSFEFNGTYTVETIINSREFTVRSQGRLTTTAPTLGPEAKVTLVSWHGSTIRIGAFDDQNGIFYQFDGQRMAVGRRSSTFQLSGTVSVGADNNTVVGLGTRFRDQLKAGDKVVLRGMTHTVTEVIDQETMTFNPDFRGVKDIVGAKMCLTQDIIIPQSEWNVDRLDGTGASGYNLIPSRMQMIGMQYSWYAAGFIEFMLRGADGRFVFFHRMRNSNVNTEAYMRTANLPVRYEVENTGARSKLKEVLLTNAASVDLEDAKYFPSSGTIYIDNELISYTGKTGNKLIGLSRSASITAFSSGQNRVFTGGSVSDHTAGTGVNLVSCTATPTISHWGSALLTDGMFDEDRGYIFNYASTGISVSTTKRTAFLIRLAPSVSNALTGDLGERDLLNRAQLLLKSISLTVDAQTTGAAGIVVEGVLNPRNYPADPNNIIWNGLSSPAAGGQPSFAQIALGGSINWGGIPSTTTSATVQGILTVNVTARSFSGTSFPRAFDTGRDTFIITTTEYNSSNIQVGDLLTNATFLAGGRTVINIIVNGFFNAGVGYTIIVMNSTASATSAIGGTVTVTVQVPQTAASYSSTNFLFFTNATWNASSATVGTRVATSVTQFPAGTTVSSVSSRRLGTVTIRRVTFSQSSNAAISAAGTITFEFGDPQYALPGEQVFAFVGNPGETSTLDLNELKELTTTAIGGRGAFPNGPDVLAINVLKVGGTAVPSNIILRWGEAQA